MLEGWHTTTNITGLLEECSQHLGFEVIGAKITERARSRRRKLLQDVEFLEFEGLSQVLRMLWYESLA
jgi:hypothetical protein